MKKNNLKIGYVIKQRNGKYGLLVNEKIISGRNGYSLIERLSDDLLHIEKRKYDIIAVYEIEEPMKVNGYLKGKGLKCIWEREGV